jgi:uncharacterized membrane protein (UPF0127 family)
MEMVVGSCKLRNQSRQVDVADHVEQAISFWSRTRGLLGRTSFPEGQALWIHGTELVACNSIHTLFMTFAIDAVFVDRDLKVKRIYRELKPWRMTWPALGAHSVFELPAGTLRHRPIEVGDQLHVGD